MQTFWSAPVRGVSGDYYSVPCPLELTDRSYRRPYPPWSHVRQYDTRSTVWDRNSCDLIVCLLVKLRQPLYGSTHRTFLIVNRLRVERSYLKLTHDKKFHLILPTFNRLRSSCKFWTVASHGYQNLKNKSQTTQISARVTWFCCQKFVSKNLDRIFQYVSIFGDSVDQMQNNVDKLLQFRLAHRLSASGQYAILSCFSCPVMF